MTNKLKGFPSIDDNLATLFLRVVEDLNHIAQQCHFQPVFVPSVEKKDLFEKSIGSTSDISQKEFFYCAGPHKNFDDRWVLRPELTTGVVHHLLRTKGFSITQPKNVFTYGNCFRYENPQKGRYREFYQWNLEQLNLTSNSQSVGDTIAISLICLQKILDHFKINKKVIIELNYISPDSLPIVKEFILSKKNDLAFCLLCRKRLQAENVYPILDCKTCQPLFLPLINSEKFLSPADKVFYDKLYSKFRNFFSPEVEIVKTKVLTRGLDYYHGLVFEVKVVDYLWSQNTIIAGGMYPMQVFDRKFFANRFGFGFALGINRFVEFLQDHNQEYLSLQTKKNSPLVVVGALKDRDYEGALELFQRLLTSDVKSYLVQSSTTFAKLSTIAQQQRSAWLVVVDDQDFQVYRTSREMKQRENIQLLFKKPTFEECIKMFKEDVQ